MNGTTLQALRTFLFFSAPEAASLIGEVSDRTWRYWESGQVKTPNAIAEKIRLLITFRDSVIEDVNKEIEKMGLNNNKEALVLIYYDNLDDWLSQDSVEAVLWRPHCSAMASIAACGATIIKFDKEDYKKWRGLKKDNQKNRALWAATKGN